MSNDQRPKTLEEENMMRQVPYTLALGSLMYAMLCIRLDFFFFFSSWHGQSISIKSRTKTLGSYKAYFKVSKENEGLYACLPL